MPINLSSVTMGKHVMNIYIRPYGTFSTYYSCLGYRLLLLLMIFIGVSITVTGVGLDLLTKLFQGWYIH